MVGWEVALAPSTQLWICLSDGRMQNKSAEQMTHAFGLVKGHKKQINSPSPASAGDKEDTSWCYKAGISLAFTF